MSKESSGFSLMTMLFLIFLVLKLTNEIHWSWWWITAPLWITAVVWLIFIIIFIGLMK